MHARRNFAGPALAAVILAACGGSTPEPESAAASVTRSVQGECADAFGAQLCSWATVNEADEVVDFGATVPLAAIEGAPDEMEMAWPPVATAIVSMPAEVVAATGLDHLTFFWEPHGHPPGAYLTPHFDFHFYNVSSEARAAIDCADETKPAVLPEGYGMADVEIPEIGMLKGLCVPEMGMHALLASELESDEIFDGTLVTGYYRGSPIFVEPMISKDLLVQRASFDLAMPTVPDAPAGVRYPQRFQAVYDDATDTYRFTFSGI